MTWDGVKPVFLHHNVLRTAFLVMSSLRSSYRASSSVLSYLFQKPIASSTRQLHAAVKDDLVISADGQHKVGPLIDLARH